MTAFRALDNILSRVMTQIPDPKTPEEHEHNKVVKYSESPIEAMMMFGFVGRGLQVFDKRKPDLEEFLDFSLKHRGEICIAQQVLVPMYRLDFCLAQKTEAEFLVVAVECGGREFHFNNIEQVRADLRRMRDLAKLRIHCLRFLGSDVHMTMGECVDEVLSMFSAEAR